MKWMVKAFVQNCLSVLPEKISGDLYYKVQSKYGGISRFSPKSRILAADRICSEIMLSGEDIEGKTFFEVGTGRVLISEVIYWLHGAEKTYTYDLNNYLKPELNLKTVSELLNADEYQDVRSRFSASRLALLRELSDSELLDDESLCELCSIHYHAPADASRTKLPDRCVDFHVSHHVFEHIPSAVLSNILSEAKRIISSPGVLVHKIDYIDHFWYADKSISKINFLKYSDMAWKLIAGNRYMYMNRLSFDGTF